MISFSMVFQLKAQNLQRTFYTQREEKRKNVQLFHLCTTRLMELMRLANRRRESIAGLLKVTNIDLGMQNKNYLEVLQRV